MIYPRLSILVTIPTLGSAHSLRKVNCCLSFHCSWTAGSQTVDLFDICNSLVYCEKKLQVHMEMIMCADSDAAALGWNQTQRSQISTSHQQQPNNVMPPCMHLHWPWPARAPSNWLAHMDHTHACSPRFMKTFWMHVHPSAAAGR
ncbi:unnamed protein product [Urochloa decumbens]|uniref:Secreted protein n=1 Tax=Urochloa decumbens TaxID=240449 RepID=A0ABC9DK96_9POAL